MPTLVYRRLFAFSQVITASLLLTPGFYLEALQEQLLAVWPFPGGESLAPGVIPVDKLVHASLFGIGGVLLVKGWASAGARWATPCAFLFGVAITTEFGQMAVPGRSMEYWDMLANSLGAGAGMALAWRIDVMQNRKTAL